VVGGAGVGVGRRATAARRIRRFDCTEVRYLAAAASASVITGCHPCG